jgi:hypothetical protein
MHEMSDRELELLRMRVIQEQEERAHQRLEPVRWNAGRLRRHLETVPDETPVLVHVPVEVPGDSTEDWIIPFVITGASNQAPQASTLELDRRPHVAGRTIYVSQP